MSMAHAHQGRREKYKRRVQAEVQQQFGSLSVREMALFKMAIRVGYNRGYWGCRHEGRKVA
jgi:hypothetical protein